MLLLLVARTPRFFDKTKVKAKSEQDEMDDRAHPVDFGRKDKISTEQRHRYLDKVEIKQSSSANEECASQKFPKLLAAPCKIKRWQTKDEYYDENCGDHSNLKRKSFFMQRLMERYVRG